MSRYAKRVFSFLPVVGWLFVLSTAYAQSEKTSFKFDFGSGGGKNGRVKVTPSSAFNDTSGFGFDFGSKVTLVVRYKNKPNGAFVTGDKPFYFSVNVPEGNYKVTVILGDVKGISLTTTRAEFKRQHHAQLINI